ncbi:hypothetical protein BGZ65_009741, partial [Modicella reniformis]
MISPLAQTCGTPNVFDRPHPLRRNRRSLLLQNPPNTHNTHTAEPASEYSHLITSSLAPSTSPISPPVQLSTPYSPPTTRPLSPLAIPEIVARIGYYILLWQAYFSDYPSRFTPKDLVRCTLVCSTWNSVLKPLVWQFYDDRMMRIPDDIVSMNAPLIKVFHGHHMHFGMKYRCKNLLQLSLTPWFPGAEDLIRNNTRLERFQWLARAHYSNIRQSVYDAMAVGMKRLKVLELSGCDLDPEQLFPLLERHLPMLQVLSLHQVNILPSGVSRNNYALEEVNQPCFRQIREIRMGKGITQSGESLVNLIKYCPNMERLVLEGIDKPWVLNKAFTESILDALISNISTFCPKFKNIEYRSDSFVAGGPALLPDANYARLVECMNSRSPTTQGGRITSNHGRDGGLDDDDDQETIPNSFTADMRALETETTLALCSMVNTLQLVSLKLYEITNDTTCRTNLLNAHQILTACKGLKHFTLEYHASHNFEISTVSIAGVLFDNPWV